MMHGSLPAKLQVLRARQGLTLIEAAEKIGIGRDTLSDLERGNRHPVMPTLAKIAEGYGVPVEELLEEPVPLDEAAVTSPKTEAPRTRTPSSPAQGSETEGGESSAKNEPEEELEAIRESFRTERDAFDGNISRWEQWLREGHPSEDQMREFLLTSKSYYLA